MEKLNEYLHGVEDFEEVLDTTEVCVHVEARVVEAERSGGLIGIRSGVRHLFLFLVDLYNITLIR